MSRYTISYFHFLEIFIKNCVYNVLLKVVDAYSSESVVLTLTGHTEWVNSVAWSPDGSKIASGSGDKTVKV